MSIPYHMHPAYGSVIPTGTGDLNWECIHRSCHALFDLAAPDHAEEIYHHIRTVHNFLTRPPAVPFFPQDFSAENFYNQNGPNQHGRLAIPRVQEPKGKRKLGWDPEFGARSVEDDGERWTCAVCGCGRPANAKVVQRHLREEHHLLTTTVSKEGKVKTEATCRH